MKFPAKSIAKKTKYNKNLFLWKKHNNLWFLYINKNLFETWTSNSLSSFIYLKPEILFKKNRKIIIKANFTILNKMLSNNVYSKTYQ